MKLERDMELVFKILKKISESEDKDVLNKKITIEGYDDEIVGYHLIKMSEANLLEADAQPQLTAPDGLNYKNHRLVKIKWDGYEFLDALKNDDIYNKFMSDVKKKGAGMSFQAAIFLLKEIIREYLSGKI